ncbi:MAG TPA: trehalose-phosphatase [Steroidobacteraceae bacterium]|nr:trehalose-phosphatase [Steroidobacteraceae bacterium]
MSGGNGSCVLIRTGAWALFLDVDGTLLEIAKRPDAVRVSERLRHALIYASERECGALALISGRSLADLDRLFEPQTFPAAGVHGMERRDARGHVTRLAVEPRDLDDARARLGPLKTASPGILIEDKGCALAVHYRQAMHLESEIAATVHSVASPLQPRFHVQPGKCVLEIKPAGCSKGSAIEAFMNEPPFAGRLPVFAGDDDTDEAGFAVVNALGGVSVHVGYSRPTAAHWRLADVNAVIRWLAAPHQPHGKPIAAAERSDGSRADDT